MAQIAAEWDDLLSVVADSQIVEMMPQVSVIRKIELQQMSHNDIPVTTSLNSYGRRCNSKTRQQDVQTESSGRGGG